MKNKITFVSLFLLLVIFKLNGQGLKINEVRHYAEIGPTGELLNAFVELYNQGNTSINLNNYSLVNNQDSIIAILPDWTIPSNSFLTIIFGQGTSENEFSDDSGGVFYTQSSNVDIFNTVMGAVGLYAANNIVDFISWSNTGSYSGNTAYNDALAQIIWSSGDFIDVSKYGVRPILALFPDGNDLDNSLSWDEYDWGRQISSDYLFNNPLHHSPKSGIVAENDSISFNWQNVYNAISYQIEIDDNEDFTSPDMIINTIDTFTTVTGLLNNIYYWRINIDFGAGFTFMSTSIQFVLSKPPSFLPAHGGTNIYGKRLAVTRISQHKDTEMLCVSNDSLYYGEHPNNNRFTRSGCNEHTSNNGPWDKNHLKAIEDDNQFIADDLVQKKKDDHIRKCEHCGEYCARASISMINRFYGGSLSQDRISFQAFDSIVLGPEIDLGHNRGFYDDFHTKPVYSWSLGGITINFDWITFAKVKTEINKEQPILVRKRHHIMVINGYAEKDGKKYVHIIDPLPDKSIKEKLTGWYLWIGKTIKHNGHTIQVWTSRNLYAYWFPDANAVIVPKKEELSIYQDTDGDGVCDFDEEEREFCIPGVIPLDRFEIDTDGDLIDDKEEIRSYTFHVKDHPEHDFDHAIIPDIDEDTERAECDCDSDNGGVMDGLEDKNQNGIYEPGETDVYFLLDDILPLWDFVEPFPNEFDVVHIWGENFKANTSYNYEILNDCSMPLDNYPINPSGSFTTDANGSFFNHPIGSFPAGLYEVIVDINENSVYDEEECGDLRKCFEIIPIPTMEIGCCWRCDENGVVVLHEGLTLSDCITIYSTPTVQYLWHPGSCDPPETYPCDILGCTDPTACNYNPDATEDDGSCILPPICNDDPCSGDIEVPDFASCECILIEPQVLGCTDLIALNYNPQANCHDGSCIYEGCCICCEDGELIYNGSNSQTDCEAQPGFDWVDVDCIQVPGAFICPIPGCTDPIACNYNPNATTDNGTCDYSCHCFNSLNLSGNIPSSAYHSSTIIQSTAIIDSGKTVEMYAPDCIHLDSGTSIKAGSNFKARIEDCSE